MTIAARVRRLTLSFDGQPIIQDISLDVPARQISVLIGRSGSGKTTFLRVFNRLNEELPGCRTQGEIELDLGNGLESLTRVANGSLKALRLQVGMLFQTPNVLPVSIWRNVALPLEKLTRFARADIAERVEKSLNDVGLWPEVNTRLQQPANRLSGGQQQRLCLARLLALEPKMLLLDEPTASLDAVSARQIEQLLQQLAQKYTILMASHSLAQVRRLADNIVVFDAGRIVERFDRNALPREEQLAALIGLY